MVRRARKPAMDARMYRHFAVVTVCLTAALAIFADGESRKAMGDGIAAHERQAALERAEVEKFGQAKLIDRSGAAGGPAATFDYSGGSAFGAPMDSAGSGDGDFSHTPRRNNATRVGTGIDYAALGLTQAEFEQLGPTEREALLREFRNLRARQARSLLEGSAARGTGELEL